MTKFLNPEAANVVAKYADTIAATPAANTNDTNAFGASRPADSVAVPTNMQITAALEAARTRLKRTTSADKRHESKLLDLVLKSQVTESIEELARVALVVAKYAPPGSTSDQLRGVLTPCASGDQISKLADLSLAAIERNATRANHGAAASDFALDAKTLKPAATPANYDVAFAKLGVTFRYDEFSRQDFIERAGVQKVIEDVDLADLRVEIDESFQLRGEKDYFYAVVGKRARANAYHPVREYLDGLQWDGVARLDAWLIDCAGASDTKYTRAVSSLPILAAVKRVHEPGAKFDEMLILQGPQGIEKSTGLATLCPVKSWFTDSMPLDGDTRTLIEQTGGKLIVEAPELKGMGKADRNTLKSMLSRTTDNARAAYGRKTAIVPRQFVIIGTINDEEYLSDPTGNRRFWPVQVVKFDLARLAAIRDQLWAEAAARIERGESIRLDPSLYADAGEAQADATETSVWVSMLAEALGDLQGRLRDLDAYRLLGLDVSKANPAQGRELASSMKLLGWKHYRDRRANESGYERGVSKERIEVVPATPFQSAHVKRTVSATAA